MEDYLGDGWHEGHYSTLIGSMGEFDVPFAPLQSVTSIKVYSPANVESTVSAAAYSVDLRSGRIYLNDGYDWPTDLRTRSAVLVTYVAGYGTEAASVPAAIRQAIMQHAAQMYECRSACDMHDACRSLLDGYKLHDMLGWV